MKNYFNKFLNVAPVALAVWRHGEALALANHRKLQRTPLLDLGCGFGEFMGVFAESQIEMGIDIDKADLVQAASTKTYHEVKRADARKLPFPDNSYQTVLSISVIEHISKVDQVLIEVYRVLKPGGYFIATMPTELINSTLLGARLYRALGLSVLADGYVAKYHQVFKHENVWSADKWQRAMVDAGFVIEGCEPTLTTAQLQLFELGLIPTLPSQVHRWMTGKRWIVDSVWRHRFWNWCLGSVLFAKPDSNLNVLLVGRKP